MENIKQQQGHAVARNHRNSKESEIFVRFEISMLNSYDMTLVRDKYGIEGWGIVLYIMKYLIERRTDCRAPLYVVGEIAHACHKNRRTILQLIADFPSLFEIEPGGKVFSSPYLLQFFLKTSTKKEKSNRSLDKLTNEAADNQEVSFPKNKNNEQEQIKDEEKEVEKIAADAGFSENKSQSEMKTVAKASTLSACQPLQDSHLKLNGRSKAQLVAIRHRAEQLPVTSLTPAKESIPRQLLCQLYQDNDYMASLEHMANLAVCKNFTVRRNVLFWFWHYCQMHAKHIRSAADAKDYLANLMRPGSNTRAQFMAYQNHLYEQRSLAQHH